MATKVKNRKIKTPKNSQKNSKSKHNYKIKPNHEPFILECLYRGMSGRATAEAIGEEQGLRITLDAILDFKHKKEKTGEYQEGREEWMREIKAEPIANAKVRIFELKDMAKKLGDKIAEMLRDFAPRDYNEINLASLIREYRGLLDQILEEAGDKVHRLKGEGFNKVQQHFYFGDDVINNFAEKTLESRKETTNLRNRFKEA